MARKLKDDKWSAFLDYVFFYACYLWLPALVLLVAWWRDGTLTTSVALVGLAVLAVCFYGRFIEPRWLTVRRSNIDLTPTGHQGPTTEICVAVFSDTHFGIFKNVMPLRRLRRRTNIEDVDLVLVAGDLTNHLRADEMDTTFAEFENFEAPVLAVLGNHDYGLPGWIMPDEIAEKMRSLGVTVLENETATLAPQGVDMRITGLRDHYAGTADYSLLADTGEANPAPHLVIAHNADAAQEYPHGSIADLTLSGHTHGGQIRLPIIYRYMIPTHHGFDRGLYHANGFKVYISSGTGMDVLPVRLFIPPCLDVLTLTVPGGKQ